MPGSDCESPGTRLIVIWLGFRLGKVNANSMARSRWFLLDDACQTCVTPAPTARANRPAVGENFYSRMMLTLFLRKLSDVRPGNYIVR